MTEKTFWEYIVSLEGTKIYTLTRNEKNTITKVENSGGKSDRVIIDDRDSFPTREDLWAAYQLLFQLKELKRLPDLHWLKEKKVSSISFAILAKLPGVFVKDMGKNNPTLKLSNDS